ncbi:MAG TPA: transposase [Firmicutes bacterium]|nr:transposase [Bacillota bacterium]
MSHNGAIKKQYSPTFKAQIVLELLKGEKSIAQISSEHGIHPFQLHKWKKQVVESLPQLFTDDKKTVDKVKNEYEAKLEELYAQIGRLTTQVNWLEKASELPGRRGLPWWI